MNQDASTSAQSKLRRAAGSALRVTFAVAAVIGLAIIVAIGLYRRAFHDKRPSPVAIATRLSSHADNLLMRGFVGCPTVQQVLDLTEEPTRENLRQQTNGIDPWGMPYQIRCDLDRVHAYSMGPDRKPRTEDDIHGLR